MPTNPKEEAWHLETLKVEESSIPKDLQTISEKNIFAALIYPLTPKQFYARYFARRALIIKGGSSKRFKTIVSDQMYDLDVKELCENNASGNVHIWFPNKADQAKGKEIKSFSTEDYNLATTAYERGGASLYFGSSLEFRETYCKRLTYQMEMNFGAYFNDFKTMGEIEIFCSRMGNLTDWHTDFQENFTL